MSDTRNDFEPGNQKPQTEAQKKEEQEKRALEEKRNEIFMREGAAEMQLLDANRLYRIDKDDPDNAPKTEDFTGIRSSNATVPKDKMKLPDGDYKSDAFPGKTFRIKNGSIWGLPGVRIMHVPPFPPTGVEEFKEQYRAILKVQYSEGCRTAEINYEHEIDVRLIEITTIMELAKELNMKVSFGPNVQKVLNRMDPKAREPVDNDRMFLDTLYNIREPERDGAERAYIFNHQATELNKAIKWEKQYPEMENKASKEDKEREFFTQLYKTPTGPMKVEEKLKKIEAEMKKIEERKETVGKSQESLKGYQESLNDTLKEMAEREAKRKDDPQFEELNKKIKEIKKEESAAKKQGLERKKLELERERLELERKREILRSVELDPDKLSKARAQNKDDRGHLATAIDKELDDLIAREDILRRELTNIITEVTNKPPTEPNRQMLLDEAKKLQDRLNDQTGDLSKAIQKSKSDFTEIKNDDKKLDDAIAEKLQQQPVLNSPRSTI